jgi:molybdate transport system substrate-binding protein
MKRLAVLLLLLLAACGTPTETAAPAASAPGSSPSTPASAAATSVASSDLTVFAAASLTEAFTEIGQQFDAANGSTTTFNFAGSQQLAGQIAQGAPADVFASANRGQMDNVIESGQVVSGTQQVFVRNRLVVIYPADNPAQLSTLEDLAKPDLRLVLAAREVPVGQYSLDFLAKASESAQFTTAYSETVFTNVVSYEENVRAVLSKVQLGEADAGIVYSSDITRDAAEQVGRIEIPDELNTIAAYPIAPIADRANAQLADRFIEYVLSSEGQGVLQEYGFISVSP